MFLPGGLNVDTIRVVMKIVFPHAVDISRGVESSPGKKDRDEEDYCCCPS